ncbi:MAG: hypothetical protein ABEI96_06305 [Haloarculaceae archaeon]
MSTRANDAFTGGLVLLLAVLVLVPLVLLTFTMPMLGAMHAWAGHEQALLVPYWEVGVGLAVAIVVLLVVDTYLTIER